MQITIFVLLFCSQFKSEYNCTIPNKIEDFLYRCFGQHEYCDVLCDEENNNLEFDYYKSLTFENNKYKIAKLDWCEPKGIVLQLIINRMREKKSIWIWNI